MFGYFYNENLRKLVVGFGSLFSNIEVAHIDPDTSASFNIRVPIHYSPQEKFIQRLLQPSSISPGTRIETQLPIISYIINTIVPDPSRRLNRIAPILNLTNVGGTCQSTGNQVKSQIPVNVSFNLFVYTRHTDDMLQIVEQIMPYFVPEHIITMDMNEVQQNVQIPIVMVSNSLTEKYEGDFNSRRLNIASFQFVAKAWIFGEIKSVTAIDTSTSGIVFDE
jgi:hypothetical protein